MSSPFDIEKLIRRTSREIAKAVSGEWGAYRPGDVVVSDLLYEHLAPVMNALGKARDVCTGWEIGRETKNMLKEHKCESCDGRVRRLRALLDELEDDRN
jgi:hypothetical protein